MLVNPQIPAVKMIFYHLSTNVLPTIMNHIQINYLYWSEASDSFHTGFTVCNLPLSLNYMHLLG